MKPKQQNQQRQTKLQYNLISGLECSKSANKANAVNKSWPTDKKRNLCQEKKQKKVTH